MLVEKNEKGEQDPGRCYTCRTSKFARNLLSIRLFQDKLTINEMREHACFLGCAISGYMFTVSSSVWLLGSLYYCNNKEDEEDQQQGVGAKVMRPMLFKPALVRTGPLFALLSRVIPYRELPCEKAGVVLAVGR